MGQKRSNVLPIDKKVVAKSVVSASYIDINASPASGKPALSEEELRVAVQRILYYGTYVECDHSSKDRAYRNISDDDIQACIAGPWRLTGVEKSKDSRTWKYKITGLDIEEDELSLVITVNTETDKIRVVTKF